MSTAAAALRAGGPNKPGVSARENLRGLWPYLGRYKGAIVLGLLTLALMGFVGTLVPLASGVIVDTLSGSSQPFSPSPLSTGHPQAPNLGNLLPDSGRMHCVKGRDVVCHALDSHRYFTRHRVRHSQRPAGPLAGD